MRHATGQNKYVNFPCHLRQSSIVHGAHLPGMGYYCYCNCLAFLLESDATLGVSLELLKTTHHFNLIVTLESLCYSILALIDAKDS